MSNDAFGYDRLTGIDYSDRPTSVDFKGLAKPWESANVMPKRGEGHVCWRGCPEHGDIKVNEEIDCLPRYWHAKVLVPIDVVIRADDGEAHAHQLALGFITHSAINIGGDGVIAASIGIPTCLSVKEKEPTPTEGEDK